MPERLHRYTGGTRSLILPHAVKGFAEFVACDGVYDVIEDAYAAFPLLTHRAYAGREVSKIVWLSFWRGGRSLLDLFAGVKGARDPGVN